MEEVLLTVLAVVTLVMVVVPVVMAAMDPRAMALEAAELLDIMEMAVMVLEDLLRVLDQAAAVAVPVVAVLVDQRPTMVQLVNKISNLQQDLVEELEYMDRVLTVLEDMVLVLLLQEKVVLADKMHKTPI